MHIELSVCGQRLRREPGPEVPQTAAELIAMLGAAAAAF